MNSNLKIETGRGEASPRPSWATHRVAPTWQAFRSALRSVTLVAMLTLFAATPSYADTWYSGASVGGDGTVYGWGVTDVTNYSMYHNAWANVTLTRPVKHRQAYSSANYQNWARADVYLPLTRVTRGFT